MTLAPGVRWCAVRGRRKIVGFYRVPTVVIHEGRAIPGEEITTYTADGGLLEVAAAIRERAAPRGAES